MKDLVESGIDIDQILSVSENNLKSDSYNMKAVHQSMKKMQQKIMDAKGSDNFKALPK